MLMARLCFSSRDVASEVVCCYANVCANYCGTVLGPILGAPRKVYDKGIDCAEVRCDDRRLQTSGVVVEQRRHSRRKK
jgi:hypothetical protein